MNYSPIIVPNLNRYGFTWTLYSSQLKSVWAHLNFISFPTWIGMGSPKLFVYLFYNILCEMSIDFVTYFWKVFYIFSTFYKFSFTHFKASAITLSISKYLYCPNLPPNITLLSFLAISTYFSYKLLFLSLFIE